MNISAVAQRLLSRSMLLPYAITATLAAICTPQAAMASDQTGQIVEIQQTGNRFFVFLSGERTRPTCDCCNRWEVTIGSEGSDAMVAALLTAFTTGKIVEIHGTGACVGSSNDTEGFWLYSVHQ